jgi:transposase-like protein
MTHQMDGTVFETVMEILTQAGFNGFAEAFRILMNEAMKVERSTVLGADPYQRSEERKGYANGFKPKTLTTRMGKIPLFIPQVRGDVDFYPSSLERGIRSERALKLAVAEMYVQGVSTRKVTDVLEKLCGLEISSSQVSKASAFLDEELSTWRNRFLGEIPYLVLDARYEKIRHGGSVISCAVLVAVGINEDGKRSVLGVSVSLSEAETHWREFLTSLQERGISGVKYAVSDDHPGLKNALFACFPGILWNRCQCHLQRNAAHHVPRVSMRKKVAGDIRDIFNALDRKEADKRLKDCVKKYAKTAPDLSEWMEEAVPEGLTVFSLPSEHWKKMRTSNMLERLNKEIKRRTSVATLFPNEASLLRLVSAVLMETSEEWESGKVYLRIK